VRKNQQMMEMILLNVHRFYKLVPDYYYINQVNEFHVQYNVYKNFLHISNNYTKTNKQTAIDDLRIKFFFILSVGQNRMVMNKHNVQVHDTNANQVQLNSIQVQCVLMLVDHWYRYLIDVEV
jgi:hypothetical protein